MEPASTGSFQIIGTGESQIHEHSLLSDVVQLLPGPRVSRSIEEAQKTAENSRQPWWDKPPRHLAARSLVIVKERAQDKFLKRVDEGL